MLVLVLVAGTPAVLNQGFTFYFKMSSRGRCSASVKPGHRFQCGLDDACSDNVAQEHKPFPFIQTYCMFRMIWIYQTFYFIFLLASVYSECVTQIYENTYFQGGDLATVFTPSANYCQIVCTYHPTCLLFTYLPVAWTKDPAKRFSCYLKDSDTEMLPKVDMEGAISGHSLKQCNIQISACSRDVHIGLDMEGKIYDATMADSYQQCQKRCTNDNHCHFFTYASETFHNASFRLSNGHF
ncbi:coagulation factor XI-like isoform X5 [Grus americana]|uniref:coagulation factor XI-like isoform X5 n=1 Tax=Grus americana TaxID=9117 RepID=UPI00240862B7|nr:coagulation factor XI-like isoform X5 [Grus americana]